MKIILKQDIPNLGFKNDIVTVKDGYGRNYLIPQGFAILATKSAVKMHEENMRQRAHKEEKIKNEALDAAKKLEKLEIKIGAKTSTTGKIFGSVNTIQIAEEIAKQVAQEVEQEFQGIYDDNEYLPVTDDKLVDEPGIDSGTVKIDPLPGPLPVHNSVVSVSTSKNAPSRPPINIPAIIKTKISGFSGIDAQDEDDDETVLENLI